MKCFYDLAPGSLFSHLDTGILALKSRIICILSLIVELRIEFTGESCYGWIMLIPDECITTLGIRKCRSLSIA